MGKKYNRYFAGLLRSQANWLNRMSAKGLRLVKTGMLSYEFEKCEPDQYQYIVEYVGHKSWQGAEDYKAFLEDMGYKVFFKNINLNYAVGKVYLRPWAEKGGKIGTSSTTLNKELLIVEKLNDGKPFELHTTYEDKLRYYKHLRNPWLCMLLMFLVPAVRNIVFWIFVFIFLIPVLLYQIEIMNLQKKSNTKEW